jgi:hypothetical protein
LKKQQDAKLQKDLDAKKAQVEAAIKQQQMHNVSVRCLLLSETQFNPYCYRKGAKRSFLSFIAATQARPREIWLVLA